MDRHDATDLFPLCEPHHCTHCLTELDGWATRCFRCNAPFVGAARHDLVEGQPDLSSVLALG